MIELIYVSKATKRFQSDELNVMLEQFRRFNQASELTGLLLYDGRGTFIQTLEGREEVVRELYKKILKDPRHSRVNLLSEKEISKRSFVDWQMGFKNLQQESIKGIQGYSDFMQQPDSSLFVEKQPSFAVELMTYFKRNTAFN